MLLGIPRRGRLSARQQLFWKHLEALHQNNSLQVILEDFNIDGAMILIEQTIPCVLHMENRTGEKILKILLVEGWNWRDSNAQTQQKMIDDIQNKVNSVILGTNSHKSNWLINVNKQNKIADQKSLIILNTSLIFVWTMKRERKNC